MLENTEGAINTGQYREMATLCTQDTAKRNKTKHTTQSVLDNHYIQTNRNNINQTWVLVQATGGKNEPNIDHMRNRSRYKKHGTRNVKTFHRTK
jgi:hypothetical protein